MGMGYSRAVRKSSVWGTAPRGQVAGDARDTDDRHWPYACSRLLRLDNGPHYEAARERTTFKDAKAFGGFSVDDLTTARELYGQTLGLELEEAGPGLMLNVAGGNGILVYPKDDHTPATYTILNFPVDDIERAVDELTSRGVAFEHCEGMTDERGIARSLSANRGPDIAWFRNPAGHVLSVLNQG